MSNRIWDNAASRIPFKASTWHFPWHSGNWVKMHAPVILFALQKRSRLRFTYSAVSEARRGLLSRTEKTWRMNKNILLCFPSFNLHTHVTKSSAVVAGKGNFWKAHFFETHESQEDGSDLRKSIFDMTEIKEKRWKESAKINEKKKKKEGERWACNENGKK